MTIERRASLYEVLIRFDANGYKGSHVIDIDEVFDADTGEIHSARELPARPITQAELGPLLGEATAGLIEGTEAAVAERVAELLAECEKMRADTAAAIDEYRQAAEVSRAEADAARAEAAEATRRAEATSNQVAD